MAPDPYKYFRIESRELLEKLTQGVLQLEKGGSAPDLVPELLRFAHTLKGAARVVKQPDIAERAHTIEDVLASRRDDVGAVGFAQAGALLELLDEMSARVAALEPAPVAPVSLAAAAAPLVDAESALAVRAASDEPLETLRVDIPEMDELLRAVTGMSVQLGLVHKALANETDAGVDHLKRTLAIELEHVASELSEVQEITHRLRLTPAKTIFPALDRVVRDAAQALGKRVDFEATGGDVRVDASVLISLRDALAHVARNAVAHGVETADQRAAAGKAPTGRVWLTVERRGGRVAFICADDGRGIDVDAVRRAAVSRGRLTESHARALSADAIIQLLYAGGLTTSAEVTELSGRGIGLDVARATAARLKGDLTIRTEPGRGTSVVLVVPVSIVAMQGLVVESSGARAAIPLDAVRQTVRISDTDIARSADHDSILHDGHVIPFLSLDRALHRAPAIGRRRQLWSAVIVMAGDKTVAVGVDRLHGTANVVARSLPALLETDPVIAGASLDADGNPQLVLDPRGLVAAAGARRGTMTEHPVVRRLPILVIDDSLTTRMLEQSILQSAGYEVELAVSAEDGMEKARQGHYSLFIVDVEMPGMDGFEFVTRTRADAVLRDIPAILVTSRNAPEDKSRGEQAGASAYIVKGEFDQDLLLRTIRRLVG